MLKRGSDYIGVGVGALIVDRQGQIFLAQRGPQAKNERGLWEFPGGSVEFGERLAEALQREMAEEYGITIAVGELLDVVDHLLPDEGQHWVSPTYLCRITAGEPTIREPGKCAATGWFDPHHPPSNLTTITRQNLEHYLARQEAKPPPAAWPRLFQVTAGYQPEVKDPLELVEGEAVTAGAADEHWPGFLWCTNASGKGGWVPASYLERRGGGTFARQAYSARELAARAGERLAAAFEESGWLWCLNAAGQSGWFPLENVEALHGFD